MSQDFHVAINKHDDHIRGWIALHLSSEPMLHTKITFLQRMMTRQPLEGADPFQRHLPTKGKEEGMHRNGPRTRRIELRNFYHLLSLQQGTPLLNLRKMYRRHRLPDDTLNPYQGSALLRRRLLRSENVGNEGRLPSLAMSMGKLNTLRILKNKLAADEPGKSSWGSALRSTDLLNRFPDRVRGLGSLKRMILLRSPVTSLLGSHLRLYLPPNLRMRLIKGLSTKAMRRMLTFHDSVGKGEYIWPIS
jgi:hypothetical protein